MRCFNRSTFVGQPGRSATGMVRLPWFGWNWAGFLWPLPWMLYRRLHGLAIVVTVATVVVWLLHPWLGIVAALGMSLAAATLGPVLCLKRILTLVEKADNDELTGQERVDFLEEFGRPAVSAAILGAVILLIALGMPVVQSLAP